MTEQNPNNEGDTGIAPIGAAPRHRALEALAAGDLIAGAAKVAGISRMTLRRWRRDNPDFRQAWELAEEAGTEQLEDTLRICARRAPRDPRYQPSLHVALCSRRPDRWRNKRSLEHQEHMRFDTFDWRSLPRDELLRLVEAGGLNPLKEVAGDGTTD